MLPWWLQKLSDETLEEFLEQCRDFTTEYVMNYAPELKSLWPLSNRMMPKEFPFEPKGAVIHPSGSPYMWNTLHLLSRSLYSSHFLVLSGHRRETPRLNYPMIDALPAPIMMLYDIEDTVPHARFLSQHTWGIELRNVGRLRPILEGHQPTPIMNTEVTEGTFRVEPRTTYDYYWRANMWCDKFLGTAYHYESNAFELPTKLQMKSLLILLRCLDEYMLRKYGYGLDPRLVLPSSAVSGISVSTLPIIPWQRVRQIATGLYNIEPTVGEDWIDSMFAAHNAPYEGHEMDIEDESFIGEQMDEQRWRAEHDDGHIGALFNQRELFKSGVIKSGLTYYGYDSSDLDFAMSLFAISRGIGEARESDIISLMRRECPIY